MDLAVKRALILLAFLASPAWAQVTNPARIDVQEEGVSQGRVGRINCVGSALLCSVAGGVGTFTVSAPTLSGTNDFTGTNNLTSTVKVYQTSTHTGNNWLGLSHDGTNSVVGNGAGDLVFQLANANTHYSFGTGNPGVFTINDNGGVNSLILTRDAAAALQLGADVNGAAIDQIIKGPDGITGTDKTGGAVAVNPGKGTGAAVGTCTSIGRNLTGATGTTAQTQAMAYCACPTKILSNTSATAQTMATITTTSTTGGSVKMFFTVVANNGTLQDTDAGEIVVGWNNNAGTVAVAASAVYGQMDSDASGTLATTPTVTAATNVVSVKFTPTWVTIVPTTVTGFATFEVNGVNTVACQ